MSRSVPDAPLNPDPPDISYVDPITGLTVRLPGSAPYGSYPVEPEGEVSEVVNPLPIPSPSRPVEGTAIEPANLPIYPIPGKTSPLNIATQLVQNQQTLCDSVVHKLIDWLNQRLQYQESLLIGIIRKIKSRLTRCRNRNDRELQQIVDKISNAITQQLVSQNEILQQITDKVGAANVPIRINFPPTQGQGTGAIPGQNIPGFTLPIGTNDPETVPGLPGIGIQPGTPGLPTGAGPSPFQVSPPQTPSEVSWPTGQAGTTVTAPTPATPTKGGTETVTLPGPAVSLPPNPPIQLTLAPSLSCPPAILQCPTPNVTVLPAPVTVVSRGIGENVPGTNVSPLTDTAGRVPLEPLPAATFPVEWSTPISMLFGPFDRTWEATADAWMGGFMSRARSHASLADWIDERLGSENQLEEGRLIFDIPEYQ